jgi:hypothetical protein
MGRKGERREEESRGYTVVTTLTRVFKSEPGICNSEMLIVIADGARLLVTHSRPTPLCDRTAKETARRDIGTPHSTTV